MCLGSDGFSPGRGVRPLRASGTRIVSHKIAALCRVLERFGAYLNQLCSLIHDASVKSVDKQKLTGYICHWRDAKVVDACCSDLLKHNDI